MSLSCHICNIKGLTHKSLVSQSPRSQLDLLDPAVIASNRGQTLEDEKNDHFNTEKYVKKEGEIGMNHDEQEEAKLPHSSPLSRPMPYHEQARR